MLLDLIDQRLEWDFVLPNSYSNFSVPPTPHCTLPLHFAHCTLNTNRHSALQLAVLKCFVVWPTVHGVDRLRRWLLVTLIDQISVRGFMFCLKGSLLQLFHFGIFLSLCPLAAGRVTQVAAESPTQGSRPNCSRGASGNLLSEISTAFRFCLEGLFL